MKRIQSILLSVVLLVSGMAPLMAGGGAPPGTPIDGGLSLLLAAGGAYGAKKLMAKRKGR